VPRDAESVGFMSVPQYVWFGRGFYSENGFRPPHENSNNPLAVKPESEKDKGSPLLYQSFSKFHVIKAARVSDNRGSFK
jgi:hypothetical protein